MSSKVIDYAKQDEEEIEAPYLQPQTRSTERPFRIKYSNVTTFVFIHTAALYGLYLCLHSARWETIVFNYVLYLMAALGITAGAHRLWSHRSYKAKMPLQIILMLFNCIAVQRTIIKWARDHRLHHKHSDTDADPHNASRGLFYSHFGWVLLKKHPDVIVKGKLIDTSDLTSNPVLLFQEKYASVLFTTLGFIIPTVIPMLFWQETFINAWHVNMFRYAWNVNIALAVNSITHRWGYRPYNSRILPSQNIVLSVLNLGEAYHNYHHAFPSDYRTAELGNNFANFSTKFIDFFASIGWAYDLKSASDETIKSKMQRMGDGSNLWGKYINNNELLNESFEKKTY